jgi:hypothetical protein
MSTFALQNLNEGRFYKATIRALAGQRKLPKSYDYGLREERARLIRRDALRTVERARRGSVNP